MIRKLEEERSQTNQLRFEIRQAKQLLAQELGEDVDLNKLLSGDSSSNQTGGWKSRTQQILLLKEKVKELQLQLGQHRNGTFSSVPPRSFSRQSVTSVNDYDEKNREAIKKLEQQRRTSVEKVQNEASQYKSLYESIKSKHDALKARNT